MKSVFKYLLNGIGWVSDKEYTVWNNPATISYRACAYDNAEPSEVQITALAKYQSNKETLDQIYKEKLISYLQERKEAITEQIGYVSDEALIDTAVCEEIVFFGNGNYALMFSLSWSEGGLAILQRSHDIIVGPQSIVSRKKINS